MMGKRALFIAATFLMVPGLSLAASAKNVKLGFINSITGPEAPIGENLSNGVTLAIEDLKKEGIDVDLIKEDDTGKPVLLDVVVQPETERRVDLRLDRLEQRREP